MKLDAIAFLQQCAATKAQPSSPQQGGAPWLYWIYGQNDFFVMACRKAIERQLLSTVKVSFDGNGESDWQNFHDQMQMESLFGDRGDVYLTLPKKYPVLASKILTEVFVHGRAEESWVVVSAEEPTAALDGTIIPAATVIDANIKPASFGRWAEWAIRESEVSLSIEAQKFLLEGCYQNFIKLHHSLQTLAIVGMGGRTMELSDVAQCCGFEAEYGAVELMEAILEQKGALAQKILYSLQYKGLEPLALLWQVVGDLRKAIALHGKSAQEVSALYQSLNIWSARQQNLLRGFVGRIEYQLLQKTLKELALLDRLAKISQLTEFWARLSDIICRLCASKRLETV